MTKACQAFILLLLFGHLCGCSEPTPEARKKPSPQQQTAASAATPEDQPAPQDAVQWPHIDTALSPDAALEDRINALLNGLTLEEKVAQMLMAPADRINAPEMKHYGLGAVYLDAAPTEDLQQWLNHADALHRASLDHSERRTPVPVLLAVTPQALRAPEPHSPPIALGASGDVRLLEHWAHLQAKNAAIQGLDWLLSPDLSLSLDARWGNRRNSLSNNPDRLRRLALAYVRGLQGTPGEPEFLGPQRVIATSVGFIGAGGVDGGADQGNNTATEEQLKSLHAAGHFAAIGAGVQSVMLSMNAWQGQPVHGHRHLISGVLKQALGFDGLVLGHPDGHAQIADCTLTQCAQAINAGIDMLAVSGDWKNLYFNTLKQVRSGEISGDRIDDAVRRILRVKLRAGLFDKGPPSGRPLAGRFELLNADDAKAIRAEAVSQSAVLLKNNNALLPFKNPGTLLLIGSPPGVSTQTLNRLMAALKRHLSAQGGRLIVSENGAYEGPVDAVIALFGESTDAGLRGDLATLEHQPGNKRDLQLLHRMKSRNLPVVSVFFGTRPLWLNPEINSSDAFVVLWTPLASPEAVADVLFGNTHAADFHARLPFNWPARPDQFTHPSTAADAALFEAGYGLRYANPGAVDGQLDEESVAAPIELQDQITLLNGLSDAPWQMFLHEQGRAPLKISHSPQRGLLGTVSVTSEQVQLPGDVRRIEWHGTGAAEVGWAVSEAVDLSAFAQHGTLSFDARLDRSVGFELTLKMRCTAGCEAGINLARHLDNARMNEWRHFEVPLRCFIDRGLDPTRVDRAFVLASDKATALSLSRVSLNKNPSEPVNTPCGE